ncbi:MAG: hypothetical protein CUN49_13065 [Candidatus Thermofonsia Clade 1 bacterium]|uniref:POTRA domain-containing protein n=1 Tax=Candidatus Thermofonsia Clade 1 bacterium TaxID=2364210 RepID=A0A2M8PBM9_9CHLR|nr:MAG: hypothetical protein CUN49_13065 [Candidatus Thermofonsia Clade 1 bacterium]
MSRPLCLLSLLALLTGLFAFAMPSSAQSSATYTITEQEINAYRLPSSVRRYLSSFSVDLQPDRAVVMVRVVSGRLTLNTLSIWQPVLNNGRLSWRALSATVEGVPLTAAQLATLNNSARRVIADAVHRYIDSRARRRYRVESVTITDSEMVVSVIFSR